MLTSPRFPVARLLLAAALAFTTRAPLRAEVAPTGFAKWEKEIAAFEQRDRESPPPKQAIVFVGSSSIKRWTTVAQDFPHHRVLNRGFGGSQMSDAAHFAGRIVLPYEPRFIVVYSGGNDLNAKKTPEQVFAAFKDFVAKVRARLPEVPIAYISIAGNPKRWAQVEAVKKVNALVEAFAREQPGLKYIDVFSAMLGPDGLPRPEIFVDDRLHMNVQGYQLWTQIVGRHLPEPDVK